MTTNKTELLQFFETTKNNPCHRNRTFDFCYNYFHPSNNNLKKNSLEQSCLALGFYLASWGMYRWSSFLLQNNAKNSALNAVGNLPLITGLFFIISKGSKPPSTRQFFSSGL